MGALCFPSECHVTSAEPTEPRGLGQAPCLLLRGPQGDPGVVWDVLLSVSRLCRQQLP